MAALRPGMQLAGSGRSTLHNSPARPLATSLRCMRDVTTRAGEKHETPSSTTAQSPSESTPTKAPYGADYYKGMLQTDVKTTNNASGDDMLKRNLQLAGGVTILLGGLVFAFLVSNGLFTI
mmetsp:Transcript_10407/g.18123  ORF Transcript_10407/g.18123 Transcript_10407/m.18123 type:complete len:121 (-) Transcript_10407:362-724(-)|eukprot:CAMPEP_0119108584 /NCGR_PEP_ID=MMETSP1180-20130426/15224_1 /TAXON_ID=3052 ORGANISM="Chlamydomonas cf sp, Strain CCMP681" /NCGR_SAMPLE_ID=MMETSP1180 /ASSEMBLY_ACC=CAM_ASM_000741 /LENGTH=120 /DNA_ID=CAMNT_0007094209 /DNA_START=23 /DNA_END=385 /DNA_ORIENTATION=+